MGLGCIKPLVISSEGEKLSKVVQEGRDEVREYGFIEMTLRIALIKVLLFIAALLEGVEQKGPFYIYGL